MVPSLLCVVRLTDFLFFGSHPEEVWSWWKLLIGFDVILFTFSLLGFEFIVEEYLLLRKSLANFHCQDRMISLNYWLFGA